MFFVLLTVFVVLPLLELALLIQVGQIIGTWPTISLVILTGAMGISLVRWQGLHLLAAAQRELQAGRLPARHLFHGIGILVAGALLLTPGFITDAMGFLLLIPPVREVIISGISARWQRTMGAEVIDVDWEEW